MGIEDMLLRVIRDPSSESQEKRAAAKELLRIHGALLRRFWKRCSPDNARKIIRAAVVTYFENPPPKGSNHSQYLERIIEAFVKRWA